MVVSHTNAVNNLIVWKSLQGSEWFCVTMNRASTSWERTKSHLAAGKTMVDRHPEASVLSPRPVGLGWDESKWGIRAGFLLSSKNRPT